MAAERQLQPAAHAEAVHGDDDRLAGLLGDIDQRPQAGLGAQQPEC